MKTLVYDQVIRVAGFEPSAQKITVGTSRGYAIKNREDPETGHQRELSRGFPTAWANQECACLTADYPGKKEAHEAKLKEIADAVEIANGELVEIEGETFKVVVTGQRYSDPVHFRRI